MTVFAKLIGSTNDGRRLVLRHVSFVSSLAKATAKPRVRRLRSALEVVASDGVFISFKRRSMQAVRQGSSAEYRRSDLAWRDQAPALPEGALEDVKCFCPIENDSNGLHLGLYQDVSACRFKDSGRNRREKLI